MATRDRDLERLIPSQNPDININNIITNGGSNSSSESVSPIISSHHSSSKEAMSKVIRSWASKKFMSGCVILLPIAITFCITWWFISFVDGFFSPIYAHFGVNIFGDLSSFITLADEDAVRVMRDLYEGDKQFSENNQLEAKGYPHYWHYDIILLAWQQIGPTLGLGFVTSISFIFLIGVFMSSWLGASVLGLGEWFIKKMPFVSYIYSASKQISAAISPDQSSNAFKEVAIIRHPRHGEYAFGFITSIVILRGSMGAEELCCVYVPTNHLYIGDIFLIRSKDILRPNLSVREGIEIVISGGMSIPQILNTMDSHAVHATGLGKFAVPPV